MPYLLQLPGFGMQVTMTVLSAIGDITRFPTDKHLVGYAGMGSSVHNSGQTYYTGRITQKGRKELRWAMVQAAWAAVRYHPFWKAHYQQLLSRKSKGKAIVAIARRLLVVVWHVMSQRVADRRARNAFLPPIAAAEARYRSSASSASLRERRRRMQSAHTRACAGVTCHSRY